MKIFSVEPVDISFFRGNRLFGGPGQHGDAMMPPWPSVFAGALRSHMIAGDQGMWQKVHEGDEGLAKALAGLLRVRFVALKKGDRVYFAPPKDLVFFDDRVKGLGLKASSEIKASYLEGMPMVPMLDEQKKPEPERWLTEAGMRRYLAGGLPGDETMATSELWRSDYRLGIGLDSEKWSVRKGAIYTSDAVVLERGVEFVVGVDTDEELRGTVRLGGDGRAAQVKGFEWTPPWEGDEVFNRIRETRRKSTLNPWKRWASTRASTIFAL